MKSGYLSQYFAGVAVKRLSEVEVKGSSNQHEFNGVSLLKNIFGIQKGKRKINARFLYLTDKQSRTADGMLTWYDARELHPYRTEWRLYYTSNEITDTMKKEDTLFLCLKQDETALVIITEHDTTIENQVKWLFGISGGLAERFEIRQDIELDRKRVFFTSGLILEQIGIEISIDSEDALDEMLLRFNGKFPPTKEFSAFAREMAGPVSPAEEPDRTLLEWIEKEELLFRILEKHLISRRIEEGFTQNGETDVDGFIKFSLSVQNRRKSRVGQALENHIEEIFVQNGISCDRTPVTENKSRPDFILPGICAYKDPAFPDSLLTMLGVKSTCKDRWRQVLDEADRIKTKHLLTLEAAISENQTNAMRKRDLQLVLPAAVHETYSAGQRLWLYSVADFLAEVKEKHKKADDALRRR